MCCYGAGFKAYTRIDCLSAVCNFEGVLQGMENQSFVRCVAEESERITELQEAEHEWHIYRDITVPITGQGDSGIVARFLNVLSAGI